MKNYLIRFLTFLVRKSTKESQPTTKKILIVTTTALGDTIWATPAIQCLKDSFPSTQIDVLTSQIGKGVFQGNPEIQEIFSITNHTVLSLIKLFPLLKKKNYSTALIFHTSQRPIVAFCSALKIPEIIGTAGMNKGLDCYFTKLSEKKKVHEVQRRLDIIKELGAKVTPKKLQIFWTAQDEENLYHCLRKHSIDPDKPLIALHPGAKDKFKQWPIENFAELGRLIQERIPCQMLITGTPPEKDLVESLSRQIPGSIPLAGELSLKSFAFLIHKLHLFVINDTGPMHIAFSQNTPTVAIFCPTDPLLCGPHIQTDHVSICWESPTCTPCLRKKCKEPFCLYQISPKKVLHEVSKVLQK